MREIRTDHPSAIHHVFDRGNHRTPIFEDTSDKELFLLKSGQLIKEGGFSLYAFCLMNNHFHFLIETGAMLLALMMHRLLTSHARRLNDKRQSPGHVFQGRYGAKQVNNDGHFATAAAYIHLNPVEANLVKRVEEWRWSGHQELVHPSGGLIDREGCLAKLDGGIAGYWAALERGYEQIRNRPPLSSLSELGLETCGDFGLPSGALSGTSRQARIVDARRAFVAKALSRGYRSKAIAKFLNRTPGAISHFIGR